MPIQNTKVCTKCGRELPTSSFWVTKTRNNYIHARCKDCDISAKRSTVREFNRSAALCENGHDDWQVNANGFRYCVTCKRAAGKPLSRKEHNKRQAQRKRNLASKRGHPLCACGCGDRVVIESSRFLKGHGRDPWTLCANGHLLSETRKRHPNGDTFCSVCRNGRSKKFAEDHRDRLPAYNRKSKIKRSYGLTTRDFEALLESQGGVCAICGGQDWGFRGPHIDHDHKTDKIRGVLCHRCNTGLGLLRDSEDILMKAISYLASRNQRAA